MFLYYCNNILFKSRELTNKAGMLLEIDIILNNVSAEESYTKFPKLTQMIFKSSSKLELRFLIPYYIKIIKYLVGFLTDY
ncbi:unnamed protein product [Penicillium salamii]|nr:unnamed protein product [Penicillium salamii]